MYRNKMLKAFLAWIPILSLFILISQTLPLNAYPTTTTHLGTPKSSQCVNGECSRTVEVDPQESSSGDQLTQSPNSTLEIDLHFIQTPDGILVTNSNDGKDSPDSPPSSNNSELDGGNVNSVSNSSVQSQSTNPTITMELTGTSGNEYYVTIELGTPRQSLEVLIDTGSYDFWVDSTFAKRSSSTFQALNGKKFSLTYADRSHVDGAWGSDSLTVQGHSMSNVHVAISPNTSPIRRDHQGLIGLGFLNNAEHPNFVAAAYQQGVISAQMFAVKLNSNTGGNAGGVLTIGGYDSSLMKGSITWSKLSSKAYGAWKVDLDGLSIGGSSSGSSNGNKGSILFDTGTSYLLLPVAIYRQIKSKSCSDIGSLPDLTFTISGNKFVIAAADYASKSGNSCRFKIGQAAGSSVIAGDVFLRKYYTIFDHDNQRIGLASYA